MDKNDVFLDEPSNYMIVLRRSNEITDVWKLSGCLVQYHDKSGGWRVVTNKNAAFFIKGDVEIWHIPDEASELWNLYQKYHAHTALKPYREMFVTSEPPPPPPPPKKGFRWPYTIKWNW